MASILAVDPTHTIQHRPIINPGTRPQWITGTINALSADFARTISGANYWMVYSTDADNAFGAASSNSGLGPYTDQGCFLTAEAVGAATLRDPFFAVVASTNYYVGYTTESGSYLQQVNVRRNTTPTLKEFPYYFGNKPYFAVTDWDGDGLTDFFAAGEASMGQSTAEFGLFLNNGDGTFRKQAITIEDAEGNPMELFDPKCVDFADFNSDGRMDLVSIGWKNDASGVRHNFNYILLNQGNFKFKALTQDLLTYGDNQYEFALSLLYATDLNNDGYADYVCQGNIDNASDSDKPTKNGVVCARTFVAALNLGAESEDETILYDLGLAESVAHHYGHGDILVADYNNDGVMDIFVGGDLDGVRTTLAQGRAFLNKTVTLKGMPDGVYEWGVQTVGANLEGSTFAVGERFAVGDASGIGQIAADSASPIVATEYYDILGRKLASQPEGGLYVEKKLRANGSTTANKVVK